MKKALALFTIFSALFLFGAPLASADTVLASYATHTNPGEGLYAFSSPNQYNGMCVNFTVGTDNLYVTHLKLEFKKNGTPSGFGAIKFRLYQTTCATFNGNEAAATLLGGNDNVTDTSTGSYALMDGPPTTNIQLHTSTNYILVATTTNQGSDLTNYWQMGIGNSAIVYTAEYYKLNGTFNAETGYNAVFEIDGNATPPFAVGGTILTAILGLVKAFWIW